MPKATLEELIRKATAGLDPNTIGYFRSSDFYCLLADPFSIWCNFHAPKSEMVAETDRHKELELSQGNLFEENLVQQLYPGAVLVKDTNRQALVNTLELMLNGVPYIYQPHLWLLGEDLRGRGDVLIRDDSAPSALGNFHYTVAEIKVAKEIKPYHKLQTASYNYMLTKIQDYCPEKIKLLLNDHEEEIVYKDVESDFLEKLSLLRAIRDGQEQPQPSGIDKTEQPWRVYANKILADKQDLTLLPNVGPGGRAEIQKQLGIKTIPELAKISQDTLIKLFGPGGNSHYWHAKAYQQGKYIPARSNPLIERRRRHLYFDIETSDDVHPSEEPHTYLIGIWDREDNRFFRYLGRGKKEEEKIWRELIRRVDRIGGPKDVCLYHWHSYETGVIDETISQYPGIAEELKSLKKACIDLKDVVKQNYYIPVSTYSIKKVGPFFGFKWRQKDVGAFESMVLYWDWLKDPKQELIDKVIRYNEDDCLAMLHIDKALFPKPFD